MHTSRKKAVLVTIAACALSACTSAPTSQIPLGASQTATSQNSIQRGGPLKKKPSLIIVVATGLENPRGLTFGPDGRLYVAEGGLGGTQSTTPEQCQQVPAPIGPYTGGYTARVSAVDVTSGKRITILNKLPSAQTNASSGGYVSGAAAVAFLHHTLYVLVSGAGCSHGLAGTYNSIEAIGPDCTAKAIVNLSEFLMNNPVAHPNPGDFEPDGTWYSMVAVGNALYAVEPNHGEVDVITPAGSISRLVDVSATQGHIVPTAIAFGHGRFVLGNLNTFDPGSNGNARVFSLTMQGALNQIASGLTAVTGVALHQGHIYALEAFTGFYAPAPPFANTGTVVRLEKNGTWTPVVSGLSFPTAMTFGHNNTLYISNKGFGQATNTSGEIVKVQI